MEITERPEKLTSACNKLLPAVDDALYVIGGKWKLRIIVSLGDGIKRFNELQRTLTGISARVLSNELKDLEMNGFVVRKVNADAIPITVEYEITDYAESLRDVVQALHHWGVRHKERIRRRH